MGKSRLWERLKEKEAALAPVLDGLLRSGGSYQSFFPGYETRLDPAAGRVKKVYRGTFFRPVVDNHRAAAGRALQILEQFAGTGFLIFASIMRIDQNRKPFPAVFAALAGLFVLWLAVAMINYLLTPLRMTEGDVNIRNSYHRAQKLAGVAVSLWLAADLVYILIHFTKINTDSALHLLLIFAGCTCQWLAWYTEKQMQPLPVIPEEESCG